MRISDWGFRIANLSRSFAPNLPPSALRLQESAIRNRKSVIIVRVRVLACLSVLAVFAVAGAQDFGPIETRNHRALALPFLRLDPRGDLLHPGEKQWNLGLTIANDFRVLPLAGFHRVEEDQETWRFLLDYRQGLSNGMEFGFQLPLMKRGGGILDPIIDWWHANVLHWSDPGRNSTPFGRSVVRFPGSSFGNAAGIGDASFSLSKKVNRRLTGSVALKLPTGDAGQLIGSGNADGAMSLYYSGAVRGRLSYYLQGGGVIQGRTTAFSGTRGLVHQESMALVWKRNSRDAWIAQWQGESAAISTGVPGSDATHRVLTFGYQRRLTSNRRLDLFFTEDRDVFSGNFPEGANIGPDFTVGARLSIKF